MSGSDKILELRNGTTGYSPSFKGVKRKAGSVKNSFTIKNLSLST